MLVEDVMTTDPVTVTRAAGVPGVVAVQAP